MGSNEQRPVPPVTEIKAFRAGIVRWFARNQREYPWRKTRDPFKVLVAEIMLRRTKSEQVKPVYEAIVSQYPDCDRMAEAEDEKLGEILYPLGLRWRSPAFKHMARELKAAYECKVPETRAELTSLPGVGDYVAGAVLSTAYGKPEWIVDSNVVRVFKRYFGVPTSKEGRRDKHIIEMAKMYVSCHDPRKANLAILDFAALICTPKDPKHDSCPVKAGCKFVLAERRIDDPAARA
ncbi:MAG: DNA glycosylase [Chloroflexi bacterium]|nr:DNA glycosylase [Chloroflexota bacterium]